MATAGLEKLVHHLRTLAAISHFRELSDGQLLERFDSQGDQIAFEVLVRRHSRLIFGVCRRALGRGPDMEDAFQATLLILARKRGSFCRQASIAGWLYSVAQRVARKHQARLARHRRREQTGLTMETIAEDKPMGNDPAGQAGWCELGVMLDEEVRRLPKKNREALVLCHLEGMSAADVAKRIGCPLPTVKSRLAKARELLRQRLARRGISLSDVGAAVLFGEHATRLAVPPKLLHTAVQAAIAYAAKPVASALVSAQAAALAQGMLKTATVAKVSLVLVALATTVAVGFGMTMGPRYKPESATPIEIVVGAQVPAPQPGSAKARVDSLSDPLPPGAVARLGTLRLTHNPPRAVTDRFRGPEYQGILVTLGQAIFSIDGKFIASRDGTFGTIHLWETATGKQVPGPWSNTAPLQFYDAIAFSPDGTTLAALGENRRKSTDSAITFWDISSGKELRVISTVPVRSLTRTLAFSEDGKALTIGDEKGVRWVEVATGKQQRAWEQSTAPLPPPPGGNDNPNRTYVFSPKGNHLAVRGRITRYEKVNERFQPVSEEEVTFIELATGQTKWRAKGGSVNMVPQMAFSADEKRIAIAVSKNRIELRDTATGKLLETPPMPEEVQRTDNSFGAVALSPDGGNVAFCRNDRVFVSNVNEPTDAWRELNPRITWHDVTALPCLTFSPDGKTLLFGVGTVLRIYDVATLKEVLSWEGHRCSVEYTAFTSDGKQLRTGSTLTTQQQEEAISWDVTTWKTVNTILGRAPKRPNAGTLSPDQQVYRGQAGDEQMCIYDYPTGKMLGRLNAPPNQSTSAFGFFSPSGKVYALFGSGDKGAPIFRLHAMPSCRLLCEIPAREGDPGKPEVKGVLPPAGLPVFSDDDDLVAILGPHGSITIRDTASGAVRHQLNRKPVGAENLPRVVSVSNATRAFSPDSKHLASWEGAARSDEFGPADNYIRIWDLAAGKEPRLLQPVEQFRSRAVLAWSPDSRMLAVGDRTIQLWEAASGKLRQEFTGHEGDIRSLAFSPDGRCLASGSTDTTVLIWDVWGK
jgi:RNA polymerase sigma factor (sigma-70 family)